MREIINSVPAACEKNTSELSRHPEGLFKLFETSGPGFSPTLLDFLSPDSLRQLAATSASNASVVEKYYNHNHNPNLEFTALKTVHLYCQTAGGNYVCSEMHGWMRQTDRLIRSYYKKLPHYICTPAWLNPLKENDDDTISLSAWLNALEKNAMPLPQTTFWPGVLLVRMDNASYRHGYFIKPTSFNEGEKMEWTIKFGGECPTPLGKALDTYWEQMGQTEVQKISATPDTVALRNAIDEQVLTANRLEINSKTLEKLTTLLVGGYISVLVLGDQRHGRVRYPWSYDTLKQSLSLDTLKNDAEISLRIGRAALHGLIPFPGKMDFLEYEDCNKKLMHELYDNLATLFYLCAKPEAERKIQQVLFKNKVTQRKLENLRKHPPYSVNSFKKLITQLQPDFFVIAWENLLACLPTIIESGDDFQQIIELIQPFQPYMSENLSQTVFNQLLNHFPKIINSMQDYYQITKYGQHINLCLSIRNKLPNLIICYKFEPICDFINIFQSILNEYDQTHEHQKDILAIMHHCFAQWKFSVRDLYYILDALPPHHCEMVLAAVKGHVSSMITNPLDRGVVILTVDSPKVDLLFEKLEISTFLKQIITSRAALSYLKDKMTLKQYAVVLENIVSYPEIIKRIIRDDMDLRQFLPELTLAQCAQALENLGEKLPSIIRTATDFCSLLSAVDANKQAVIFEKIYSIELLKNITHHSLNLESVLKPLTLEQCIVVLENALEIAPDCLFQLNCHLYFNNKRDWPAEKRELVLDYGRLLKARRLTQHYLNHLEKTQGEEKIPSIQQRLAYLHDSSSSCRDRVRHFQETLQRDRWIWEKRRVACHDPLHAVALFLNFKWILLLFSAFADVVTIGAANWSKCGPGRFFTEIATDQLYSVTGRDYVTSATQPEISDPTVNGFSFRDMH